MNKPAGLLVHRSPIDRHETRFALQLLRDQLGQRVYPLHRLDKPTSGVLLFGRTAEAAKMFAPLFAARKVVKTYLAVVRGWCPDQGLIEHPLTEEFDHAAVTNSAAAKKAQAPRVQDAETRFRLLGTAELPIAVDKYPNTRYSLVQLQPITGRRHQLRRHMKHISHPIIGDANHGKGVHNRFFQRHFNCHRLLLTCTRVELQHPVYNTPLNIEAAPGDVFEATAEALGWKQELARELAAKTKAP
ncbi:MAG: pseudouridine synthase [Haliea sp.]|nr:pseudouridine synthase [Haliea sp.]